MPPKRGTKVRGRGAGQASSRPPIANGPPSFFTPPSGQGTNLSWQTPGPQVPQAPRGSTSGSRGSNRGGRSSRGIRGARRGSLGTRTAPTTQTSADAAALTTGQKPLHLATPARPSSAYITLRFYSTKNTASEPFVTLRRGKKGAAASAEPHSNQNPPKPLTLFSPSSAQSQESPLPLPSLISATTTTPNFGPGLGPETPLESVSSNQPTATDDLSKIGVGPSKLSTRICSPETRLDSPQGFGYPGESGGRSSNQAPATVKTLPGSQFRPVPRTMAPITDTTGVQAGIKDVIQNLYDIQSQTHGYVPDTADLLVDKMTELAQSLNDLQNMTSTTVSPNNPIHSVLIAPEIVDYVDDGRNPDIFTRDFVENVQRGNAVINGKQKAFKDFSEVFAQVLKERMPQLTRHVDRIMDNAGFDTEDTKETDKVDGANGAQPNGASSGQRQQDSAFSSATTG
ncbi:hypothetical protein LTR84_007272 [Exophiala bonariae]|uniref:Mediator complex subunit 10 n=1 Tax=Exophiala bonariae TaxID=1690606 RepID=A0AAV9MYY6_9EURO|nr:hypothetical protein LTR84_007272 [Exophiala bonariae]